jgi:hypothetical protein
MKSRGNRAVRDSGSIWNVLEGGEGYEEPEMRNHGLWKSSR